MAREHDKFAAKVIRALRAAGQPEPITYAADSFSIDLGPDHKLFLQNLHGDYNAASFFKRRAVLRTYVQSCREIDTHPLPASLDEARPNLLPFVRDQGYWAGIALHQRAVGIKEAAVVPRQEIGGGLVVSIAYDTPTQIASVSEEQLRKWGVSLEDALKVARFNLRARTPSGLQPIRPGVYMSPYEDFHGASRIMLDEVITRLDVKGDPVAFVPSRDGLIITGADDDEGLVRAAEMARELLADNRRISGSAVRLHGGKWHEFLPEAGEAREEVRRTRLVGRLADYQDQKELLQKIDGDEVFVADFKLIEPHGGGEWFSYTVWTEGIPILLSVADKIGFFGEGFNQEGDPRMGPYEWEKVEEVMQGAMVRQGLVPERVKVTTFPTEEEMARIRAG